jgi:hypothetical protein
VLGLNKPLLSVVSAVQVRRGRHAEKCGISTSNMCAIPPFPSAQVMVGRKAAEHKCIATKRALDLYRKIEAAALAAAYPYIQMLVAQC